MTEHIYLKLESASLVTVRDGQVLKFLNMTKVSMMESMMYFQLAQPAHLLGAIFLKSSVAMIQTFRSLEMMLTLVGA